MNLFMLIIQALACIATVVTAFLVYLAWKQIKLVKEQATTSFEDGLTQHYRQIMESIPINIWLGSALETLNEERQNRCRDAIYRYIDLCQDQVVLHAKKRINRSDLDRVGGRNQNLHDDASSVQTGLGGG